MNKEFYNYIVYDDGRVYSKYVNRFLKPFIDKFGYVQYILTIDGHSKHCRAHRLVAELFIPNPNNYECVNHKDGNKQNNTISNLEWCTVEYNNKHARENNLNNVSESNRNRWKNEEFRKKVSNKISQTILSKETNKGENNPRFRYRIFLQDKIISRTELSDYLHLSQSYCDALIRKSTKKEIPLFQKHNIKVIDLKEGQQTIERIS